MPKSKSEVTDFQYKAGDVIRFYIGRRVGYSFGEIIRVMGANVRIKDIHHYNKELYVQKSNVVGPWNGDMDSLAPPIEHIEIPESSIVPATEDNILRMEHEDPPIETSNSMPGEIIGMPSSDPQYEDLPKQAVG